MRSPFFSAQFRHRDRPVSAIGTALAKVVLQGFNVMIAGSVAIRERSPTTFQGSHAMIAGSIATSERSPMIAQSVNAVIWSSVAISERSAVVAEPLLSEYTV